MLAAQQEEFSLLRAVTICKLQQSKLPMSTLLLGSKFGTLFSATIRKALQTKGIILTAKKGERLAIKGHAIINIYFLVFGRVVSIENYQGIRLILSEGQCFNEECMFARKQVCSKFSLQADEQSTLLQISRKELVKAVANLEEEQQDRLISLLKQNARTKRELLKMMKT